MTMIKSTFVFSMMMLGLLCGYVPAADAGCRINYSFQRSDDSTSALIKNFSVISKGGKWKQVWGSRRRFLIDHGNKYDDIYKATFKCTAKRRYRYEVCGKNIYYPSATGWTTSTDINFGDVSRHCR